MAIHYIEAKNQLGDKFRIPVVDVREGPQERRIAEHMVKTSHGNMSKFVPAKWGYGTFGPKKY